MRLIGVNAATLKAKKPQLERYMKAYRETIDILWQEQGLKEFADWIKMPLERVRTARDKFFPKEGVNPDKVHGIDELIKEAINNKALAAPLTKAQVDELFQVIPR